MVIAVAVLAGLALAVAVVHVGLTLADRRGWVYYRNPHRPPPRSLGLLEEIYQPSISHVVEHEVEEDTLADTARSGDEERPGRGENQG
jgi:hypothetical protein